jgi:type IV pilus assembly protein PilV
MPVTSQTAKHPESSAMHRSAGFSLIEVLISIVILSVALLGTAGLTAASLKSTNTSYYRSQATVLADDMLDRMRANVIKARGGQYNIDAGKPTSAAPDTLEKFDCDEWLATLADTLPGGEGTVTVNPGSNATIVITWSDGEIDADGAQKKSSFSTVSQL